MCNSVKVEGGLAVERVDVPVLTRKEEVMPFALVAAHISGVVDDLLLENMAVVSSEFSKISTNIERLKSLVGNGVGLVGESGGEVAGVFSELSASMGKSIVALQFQDRVSQNLVILKDMSEAISVHLRESFSGFSAKDFDRGFNEKVMDIIKLGEIKDFYVRSLIDLGIIISEEDIGYKFGYANQRTEEDDNIDLF